MGAVTAWVTSSCADLDLLVTSPGERTHDRPWSYAVVHDVRNPDGTNGQVWFKANGIGTRHEPGLVAVLGSLVPDLVPEVLAVDTDRAWSLTRHAGPTWRSAIPVPDQWPLWGDLLQRYAEAQLSLAAHRPDLLAAGLPERSPATLPSQAGGLVAELALLGDESGGLPAAEARALEARLPAYGQWCRELSGAGIPWTIQHDDLHASNVCSGGTAGGRASGTTTIASTTNNSTTMNSATHTAARSRVIDWGDASFGHPFGTMLATLRSIARHGGCEIDDPRVQRVRDAYLEPFSVHAPRQELLALVKVAQRIGWVTRALSWSAALAGSPTEVHRRYDFPIRGWLRELL